LPRVMAFVENGGLASTQGLSRQTQEHTRSPGRSVSPIVAMSPSAISGGTDLLDDLAEAATALLEFVTRSVRR
jgi:hypothetical protein